MPHFNVRQPPIIKNGKCIENNRNGYNEQNVNFCKLSVVARTSLCRAWKRLELNSSHSVKNTIQLWICGCASRRSHHSLQMMRMNFCKSVDSLFDALLTDPIVHIAAGNVPQSFSHIAFGCQSITIVLCRCNFIFISIVLRCCFV